MEDPLKEGRRFRILVCIDGSDESYNGLRYAEKMGRGVDADIVLLYVRQVDQVLGSGGLDMRVARENMLDWGLELPGIKYLKKGHEILLELGEDQFEWEQKSTHTDVVGDPLGDNKIEYTNQQGKSIVLKLKVASDIVTGILDQWELRQYDLIILGASSREQGVVKSFFDPAVAERIAVHAPCSVLLARELAIGHGHLICIDGSDISMDMVRKDAILANRCECPVSLMSVAEDVESEDEAKEHIRKAKDMLESLGITVTSSTVAVGDPVNEIIEAGPDYSLIVLSDSGKTGLKRMLIGSVAFKVMRKAYNSVMIIR